MIFQGGIQTEFLPDYPTIPSNQPKPAPFAIRFEAILRRIPASYRRFFASELVGLQKLAVQVLRVRVKGLDFCESRASLGEYPGVSLPEGGIEHAIGDLVSTEQRGGLRRRWCFSR